MMEADMKGDGNCENRGCKLMKDKLHPPKPIDPCSGSNPSVVCANSQTPKNTCNESGSAYSCAGVITEPASITPSEIQIQSGVIDDDYTDPTAPDNPPTVNGQTFTPAYGGGQRGIAGLELFLMFAEALHFNTSFYSNRTGSYAQGVIPLLHHNESGLNVIPGVGIINDTGMVLNVADVAIDGKKIAISGSPIPNGGVGSVIFSSPEIMGTYDISVKINFQAIQSNGLIFGLGQITYNGPNYIPVYGPPPP